MARGTLAIVGAGATHTVVITGQGQGAVVARGAVTVTLRGLSVAHDVYDVVTGSVADVSVTEGASATLRDVLFARPQTALRVEGAMSRAVADGLTVRGARGDAVAVYDAARATLRDVLLRDGRAVGVRCDASAAGGAGGRVQLVDALVAGNLGGGVRLAGRGVFNTGARCDAADLAASVGEDDCLLRVAVQGNTGAGVVATDARGVEVRRAHIGATRAGAAGAGDGVSIARGADVRFDDDLSALPPETVLRRGTQVLENARAGVLVDGAGTALRVHGMLSGSNGGPGALLQQGAHAPAVNACVFSDNVGLGLGVSTGASVAAILCDQFLGARGGTWGAVAVGDGLSIYGGRFDAMRDNEMSGNARFGLVLSGVAPFSMPGVEALRNAGSGNGFGAAVYGAPMGVFDRLERITGRAPAPAADPGGVSTAL